ncbi:GNAT family N-acetyltransferase [Oerskovia flava]|uniref:GNAT family N-acetyltransferase n=1 Tax=Oerskovia flava TaxID=2986422 RepID=UPI00223FBF55|nr:GNAT family N-acetyltransferase [Oerskovia sp. JB1-3-2]
MTPDELDELDAAHTARLARLDPAVPAPTPLTASLDPAADPASDPASDPARPSATGDGLFAVRLQDGSRAAGVAESSSVDERSAAATFRALHEHRLRPRVAGPDVPGALGALLDRWTAAVDASAHEVSPQGAGSTSDPRDRVLAVSWPSRDVAGGSALLARGFRPTSVVAARPPRSRTAGAPDDDRTDGVVVRDAVPADLEAVVAQQLAEIAYDDLTGAAHLREHTRAVLDVQVAAAIARPRSTVLVAESGGRVVGVVAVDAPELSTWMAGTVVWDPVAYLVLLHVHEDVRGRGLGELLARAAIDRVGPRLGQTGAVVLHHGALNPLSTPFWARLGFRPVHTAWELPVGRTP